MKWKCLLGAIGVIVVGVVLWYDGLTAVVVGMLNPSRAEFFWTSMLFFGLFMAIPMLGVLAYHFCVFAYKRSKK